jgi:hypothetical protein
MGVFFRTAGARRSRGAFGGVLGPDLNAVQANFFQGAFKKIHSTFAIRTGVRFMRALFLRSYRVLLRAIRQRQSPIVA